MQLGVLGPVELVVEGARVALGGPKQRLVIGLLAAWRGRVVSVDELIDGLWPEGPQARPRKTVQVYVTRLRRALGGDADAIRSEAAGYRLDATRLPVDADEFVAGIQAAAADEDDDRAIAALRAALGRWRGDAFIDLRDCPALVPSAVQLDERRLAAMYELFEREIRRRPREIIAELEQAVEANPLHEGFAAQLMTAQYRAGRQADALKTYQNLRRRLADELGLEPGPEVRELEGRILRHELSVARSAPPAMPERQRRRVTVVAAELAVVHEGPGPLDPEDEMALVAPVRRAARARIVERGGVVLAEAGDGLSACFGYPSTDRSTERAVLAALALRDLAAGTDGRVAARIGVDTGVVVIESPDQRDGGTAELSGIAGEPLRSAMRLRDAAATGQVLVGPATAESVRDLVELDPVEPGADGPAIAVRMLVAGRAAPRTAGLVGRRAALDELQSIARQAVTQVRPVVVSGPAGIGKSALVEVFVAGLDDSWSAIQVYCDRRHSATPLHPFRPLLPELFDAGDEPTSRAVVVALRARWGDADPLLIVEDVDAADPSTIDLLAELPDQLASGLVVLTSRSMSPLELNGDVVARVMLGPLDRAASRQVAARLAGDRRLRLDVLNEIADRAGGVPMHIDALTRAVLDHSSDRSVPTSLYDSLMSGLDRLGPARALAQRLSVLGPSFDSADLEYVTGDVDPSETAARLAAMVAADVLRFEDGRYRFTSTLVAEAAYDSLLHADRIGLHSAIADAMTETAKRTAPERLAFHLEAAGRPFDAAVAWRRASGNAIRRARHREAEHHARRALRVLDELGVDGHPDAGSTRRQALTNLAIGLQAIRHGTDELLEVVAEARLAGVGQDDLGGRVLLDIMEISNHHERGEFAAAEAVAEASVEATESAGDEFWSAFAHQFLGACLVWQGQLVEGTRELERAAVFWDRDGTPGAVSARAVGAMWSLLGLAACFADRPDDTARLLVRARGVDPGRGRLRRAASWQRPARWPTSSPIGRRRCARRSNRCGRWRSTSAATSGSAGPRHCSGGRSPTTRAPRVWR